MSTGRQGRQPNGATAPRQEPAPIGRSNSCQNNQKSGVSGKRLRSPRALSLQPCYDSNRVSPLILHFVPPRNLPRHPQPPGRLQAGLIEQPGTHSTQILEWDTRNRSRS
jgi:hypothetical protein